MTRKQLWIEQAQRGERAVFNQLVRQYEAMAFGLAYHLLGERQLAEAAMEQSVLLSFQQLNTMQEQSFCSFLLGQVIDVCQCFQSKLHGEIGHSPEQRQHGLRLLPFEQQVALLLSDTYGFSQTDIESVMGIPPERIAQAVTQGRSTLRQHWFGVSPSFPHRREWPQAG